MRGDDPRMSKGILQASAAIAIKLIGNREDYFGASRDGALGHGIHIFDVELDRHRRTAERLRAAIVITLLGRDVDRRVPYPDLRMDKLSARVIQTRQLGRAECLLVEFDRARRIANYQAHVRRMITTGNVSRFLT